MNKVIHKYEYNSEKQKTSSKCIFCKTEITDEEFEYEDYFILFRGFSPDCVEGFVCYECKRKLTKQ